MTSTSLITSLSKLNRIVQQEALDRLEEQF